MRVARRIVVVGMTNPQSRDPEHALHTQPTGCTGHRLWQLAAARSGISEAEWLEMTDRRNLCLDEWDRTQAWESAREMTPDLEDKVTVLLGADVAGSFTNSTLPGICQWGRRYGTPPRPAKPWVLIPHPSGLNRWYNDPTNRAVVEILLADLVALCTEREEGEADEPEESERAAGPARGGSEVALETEL